MREPDKSDRPHILLIEDNPDHILLARKALLKAHHQVDIEVVTDGCDAIEYIKNMGQPCGKIKPDLILLDLDLPSVHGLEILKILQENSESTSIPVFVVTSSSDQETINRAYQLGIQGHIKKPMNLDGKIDELEGFFKVWKAVIEN